MRQTVKVYTCYSLSNIYTLTPSFVPYNKQFNNLVATPCITVCRYNDYSPKHHSVQFRSNNRCTYDSCLTIMSVIITH